MTSIKKIAMIHGQNHIGTTCRIGRQLAGKIGGEVTEFFLPRDFDSFCVGCNSCFLKSKTKCPHYEKIRPITEAIVEADVIILTSPVYVYHVTGAMKAWLEHYGYQWIVHRPEESMFTKQAVCISTAAGKGTKSTNQDMADSLWYWGVGKIYRYGENVHAVRFKDVDMKKLQEIDGRTTELARKIRKNAGHVKPGLKTRFFFQVMKKVQQKGGRVEVDRNYWDEKGWTKGKKPW